MLIISGGVCGSLNGGGGLGSSPKVGGGDVAVGAGVGEGRSAPPSLGSLLLVSPVVASWPALSFFMALEAPWRTVLAPLHAYPIIPPASWMACLLHGEQMTRSASGNSARV